MGAIPSQTSYYTLPSTAIRICRGHDHCFCNSGYHRKEKYVYVDRRSDGRERYHDMMEVMGKYMMGMGQGGGGGAMAGQAAWPFRDAREWTVRDYDRLGDVMKEFYDRERGRGRWAPGEHNGGGMMGVPMGMGMYPPMSGGVNPQMMAMNGMNMPAGMMPPPPPGMPTPPTNDTFTGHPHQPQHPTLQDFQHLQQDLEEKFRHYNRHMGILFGTDQDRQKDQYRATMLKTLQEILPQLAQMMAGQQQRGMGMNPAAMMGGYPPPQMAMPPPQNPMAYGPPHPAMMGQVPGQPPPMQSPYAQGVAAGQGQGYGYDPMPPLRRGGYRRRKWQDRDDGEAFCSDFQNEQRRTMTPWDSFPHRGGGRFGRRDDEEDLGGGGAMPLRPRSRGPFDGGGPGVRQDFDREDAFPPPRHSRCVPPPPPATMSMGDTMPTTMSGVVPPLPSSPHLGRRTMDTQPLFPGVRSGLGGPNTAMRHSHLDPDFDGVGPSGANVRINLDPQVEAGAAAAYGGSGGGGGGFGRSSMGDGLGPGASSMGMGVGIQGAAGGYVPETAKLSQGRDVEDRRDEPDLGQGITDHTGR